MVRNLGALQLRAERCRLNQTKIENNAKNKYMSAGLLQYRPGHSQSQTSE